ncbi:MAG: helix-turn-helix domain-containing protein [Beijerinckiaceae bacterium]
MPDMEFTLSAVTAADHYDRWRAALSDAFGPFEVHRSAADSFAGHVRYTRRVSLQFNDLHYRGQGLERTAENVSRLDQEFYTFGIPLSGPLAVTQCGRQFQVEPGCLYLCNQSVPYRAQCRGDVGYRSLSISLPRAALLQRDPHIGHFYKLRADDGSPRVALLTSYLNNTFKGMNDWSDGEIAELGERLIDLVVLFFVQPGRSHASESDSSVTLAHRERVVAYVRCHLSDPGLAPDQVARACGISVSYLHRVFRGAGSGLEAFIYTQRLEVCHALLASKQHAHRSIAELAYQVGFSHPSHFSRLFKRRYGMSASDFRNASQIHF